MRTAVYSSMVKRKATAVGARRHDANTHDSPRHPTDTRPLTISITTDTERPGRSDQQSSVQQRRRHRTGRARTRTTPGTTRLFTLHSTLSAVSSFALSGRALTGDRSVRGVPCGTCAADLCGMFVFLDPTLYTVKCVKSHIYLIYIPDATRYTAHLGRAVH